MSKSGQMVVRGDGDAHFGDMPGDTSKENSHWRILQKLQYIESSVPNTKSRNKSKAPENS